MKSDLVVEFPHGTHVQFHIKIRLLNIPLKAMTFATYFSFIAPNTF